MTYELVPWIPVAVLVIGFALTRLGKVPSARAHELVAAGAALVDVRTQREFASGHLPGAMSVPLDKLATQAPSLVGVHKPIVVYCASGMRSAAAKRVLRRAGASEVYDLGAMGRW